MSGASAATTDGLLAHIVSQTVLHLIAGSLSKLFQEISIVQRSMMRISRSEQVDILNQMLQQEFTLLILWQKKYSSHVHNVFYMPTNKMQIQID